MRFPAAVAVTKRGFSKGDSGCGSSHFHKLEY
jgi:hypothetical protein